MSVNITLLLVTKEQMANQYEADKLLAGEAIDFSDVVHEKYPTFWMSPRDWFFEDYLKPRLTWGNAAIFTKQALLDMLPPARAYLEDPENEFEDSTIGYIRADYLDLEIKLLALDESAHTIIGYKC